VWPVCVSRRDCPYHHFRKGTPTATSVRKAKDLGTIAKTAWLPKKHRWQLSQQTFSGVEDLSYGDELEVAIRRASRSDSAAVGIM
jgi:hypothetical protein